MAIPPHGQCNALVPDGAIDFKYGLAEPRYRDIATAMGVEMGGFPSAKVRKRIVEEIRGCVKRHTWLTLCPTAAVVAKLI